MQNLDNKLLYIDHAFWVLSRSIGEQKYDFSFETFFPVSHPINRPDSIEAIARVGAIDNYDELYTHLLQSGIALVNSPKQHFVCSEFSGWYEELSELTPLSKCYSTPPSAEVITENFGWPIFMKGSRQTSRHNRKLSIIQNAEDYDAAVQLYKDDEILHWQDIVVRKFVPLRIVDDSNNDKIPAAFEIRFFFWKQHLVGFGNYWSDTKYKVSPGEISAARKLAEKCSMQLMVPFLVIDIAQTAEGNWILIECNDAQESGYAEISRIALWQNILEIERRQNDFA